MPDNFAGRNRDHERAMRLVEAVFAHHGIRAEAYGTEEDRREAWELLMNCLNDVAIRQRYRPDLSLDIPGYGCAHCEVKSGPDYRLNFAIEDRAWWAAREAAEKDPHAMAAFVEMRDHKPHGRILACYIRDIPLPVRMNMPVPRWDNTERKAWIGLHYPGTYIHTEHWGHASGTPYFLVPKSEPYFIPFEQFIRERLLSLAHQPEPPGPQRSLGLEF